VPGSARDVRSLLLRVCPVPAQADAYKEAGAFCAEDGKSVDTIKLDAQDSDCSYARPVTRSYGHTSLGWRARCATARWRLRR